MAHPALSLRNVVVVVASLVTLAGCGGCTKDKPPALAEDGGATSQVPPAAAKPKVAVSIFPLYDVARSVAGDRLEVLLVLPPGRTEHGYDPSPKEVARL